MEDKVYELKNPKGENNVAISRTVILKDKNHSVPALVILANSLIHEAVLTYEVNKKANEVSLGPVFHAINILAEVGQDIMRHYLVQIGTTGTLFDLMREDNSTY